jgi:two-component system sensor histidine kinase MprB
VTPPGLAWLRRRSLRTRLALSCTLAVALVAVGVTAAAFVVVRHELERQLDLQLGQQATLVQQLNHGSAPGVVSGECVYLSAPACSQIVPADPAADPPGRYLLPVTPATREVAAGRRNGYYSDLDLDGRAARMLTTSFGGGKAVQVAVRSDTVQQGVTQAAELMALVGALGVLLAAGLGRAVSRTGLRPVARLTATAERIAATRDPKQRVRLPSSDRRREDELTRLAASFNTMLGELERSVTARRRLVADASHELRTPLTALRTNAELLARADRLTPEQLARAATALQRQIREITSLVNDLIELAREEEPVPLLETVRLDLLAGHCLDAARLHWPGIAFVAGLAPGVTVEGVPARLSRLLANLLDNAAKFSPPGGPVELELVRADGTGPAVELTVRDHGPGIAAEDLPYVFDRFYRATAARALPGSGLGLAMAQQIAQAHHAVLTAEPAPGGGALFRLRIRSGQKPAGST